MPWTEEEAKKKEEELKKKEEELKKKLAEAEAQRKLDAAKSDEELKKVSKIVEELKAEKDKKEKEQDDKKKESILKDFPEEARDMIRKLRDENAERRVKTKTFEEEIQKLKDAQEKAEKEKQLSDLAVTYQIKPEAMGYFEYRVKLAKVGGEMPPTEELKKIAKEVNNTVGDDEEDGKKKSSKKKSSTFDGKRPEPKDDDEEDIGDLTLDEFLALNIAQKSNLYHKDKDLYLKLKDMADSKGKSLV